MYVNVWQRRCDAVMHARTYCIQTGHVNSEHTLTHTHMVGCSAHATCATNAPSPDCTEHNVTFLGAGYSRAVCAQSVCVCVWEAIMIHLDVEQQQGNYTARFSSCYLLKCMFRECSDRFVVPSLKKKRKEKGTRWTLGSAGCRHWSYQIIRWSSKQHEKMCVIR